MGLKRNAYILLHKIESHLAGLVTKSVCQTLLSSIHLQSMLVLKGPRTVSSEEVPTAISTYLCYVPTYVLYCSDGTNIGFMCQPFMLMSATHSQTVLSSWHS